MESVRTTARTGHAGRRSRAGGVDAVHRALAGRIIAVAWLASGILSIVSGIFEPGSAARSTSVVIGACTIVVGLVALVVPWARFPQSALLWMVPVAFALIVWNYAAFDANGFTYSISFALVFVLVGISQPRWTAVKLLPLFLVAYLVPIVAHDGWSRRQGFGDVFFVVPLCIVLGELIGWIRHRMDMVEGEMVQSEASLRELIDHAPIGISRLGLDGRLIEVNKAYAAILGYQPEDLAGRAVRDLTHPDDWTENRRLIEALRSREIDRFRYEKRFIHADGHYVWVAVTGSAVRDDDGNLAFMIGQLEDITEHRQLQDQLAHTAVTDALTGLPNRVRFMDELTAAIARSEQDGFHVALMFLDLDRFKMVNDGLGHDAGDRLLQAVARRLRGALRADDVLARFGGDEFTVLCEVSSPDDVVEIVARLRQSLALPIVEPEFEQYVTTSIGVALSTSAAMLPSTLMRCADIAMFEAKRSGPGQFAIYREESSAEAGHNLRTQNELHRAIRESQLVLHYQPIIDLADLSVAGTEALVRWQHPTRGLLPPSEFVELAEECGLMTAMGNWILTEACRQGGRWAAATEAIGRHRSHLDMAVNVSPKQLTEPGFVDVVADALAESGFPADRLWLEITEGALLLDPLAATAILEELRELGVHLSIDDFGTGYSSLSYLRRLPVETLKIDRSFVDQLETATDDRAIVQAVIGLGASLGLRVVAEGIERHTQAAELARLGCRYAQGYLYAMPTDPAVIGPFPPEDVPGWSQLGAVEVSGRPVHPGPVGPKAPGHTTPMAPGHSTPMAPGHTTPVAAFDRGVWRPAE